MSILTAGPTGTRWRHRWLWGGTLGGAALAAAVAAILLLGAQGAHSPGAAASTPAATHEDGVVSAPVTPSVIPEVPAITGTVLLLAPADAAVPGLEDAELAGRVRRYTSPAQMELALDDTVQAIAVEAGSASAADWGWLRQRFLEGRVVVGINIHMGEFQGLLGDRSAGSFGRMTIGEGFVSALAGGDGSPCSAGVYSQTSLAIAVRVLLECAAPRFRSVTP